MARRSRKKRRDVPKNPPVIDPKTGLPDLRSFILWLNNTPEAKVEFSAFCRKHRLEVSGFQPWNERKNYSGNATYTETSSGYEYDFGFRGARDHVGLSDPDLLSEEYWKKLGPIHGD